MDHHRPSQHPTRTTDTAVIMDTAARTAQMIFKSFARMVSLASLGGMSAA
jgi:hypothetical protein